MLALAAAVAVFATSVNSLALPAVTSVLAPAPTPTVKLAYATYAGSSSNGINSFLGMRYAAPPIEDLRFRNAVPPLMTTGVTQATAYGSACIPQQLTDGYADGVPSSIISVIQSQPQYQPVASSSEDCLFVNVIAPANIPNNTLLPILVWIYGGGFEVGSTSESNDGAPLVARSVALGSPMIFISMNYRLAGYGFMASQEIKDEKVGNIGLQDQRAALRWIQTYAQSFGGDKTKVVVWGESAGAISVALQMVTNGGNQEGLFRGAYTMSGSPIPVGSILNGQKYYDKVAELTGCSGNGSLACLRKVPTANLTAAIDQTPSLFAYQSLNLAWLPRVDGEFLVAPPLESVQALNFSKIPMMSSDCDDEATLFSVSSLNVTTNDEAIAWIKANYAAKASDAQLAELALHYPQDPTQGSPFDTGFLNQLSPQFKRLAAFQGDIVFQAPRRWWLSFAAPQQPIWAALYKRGKATPGAGAFHASDLTREFYSPGTGAVDFAYIDYLVSFVNTLNPNSGATGQFFWPQYTAGKKGTFKMLTFVDGVQSLIITFDTYRSAALTFLNQLSLQFPF